jgi:hypothetical protein
MNIPLVVCYTTEKALNILEQSGIDKVEIIKTQPRTKLVDLLQGERVICQRERNGVVQLVVC